MHLCQYVYLYMTNLQDSKKPRKLRFCALPKRYFLAAQKLKLLFMYAYSRNKKR